jgi:hypothetical protein
MGNELAPQDVLDSERTCWRGVVVGGAEFDCESVTLHRHRYGKARDLPAVDFLDPHTLLSRNNEITLDGVIRLIRTLVTTFTSIRPNDQA